MIYKNLFPFHSWIVKICNLYPVLRIRLNNFLIVPIHDDFWQDRRRTLSWRLRWWTERWRKAWTRRPHKTQTLWMNSACSRWRSKRVWPHPRQQRCETAHNIKAPPFIGHSGNMRQVYHSLTKLREGNVFTRVCLSCCVQGWPHVTITDDALNLTIQPLLPPTPRNGTSL